MKNFVDDRNYWNQFYGTKTCPEQPSPFACYAATFMQPGCEMVELGCGNGRDAVYFAGLGIKVTAIDTSQTAIDNLKSRKISNAKFICDDFITTDCHTPNRYDYAYSRFTLHAIDESQEKNLLQTIFHSLKKGGKFFIEVRSVNDPLFGKGQQMGHNSFFYENHYRRFIVLQELTNRLEQNGFDVEYAEEKTGFAPYRNDDPPVIRVLATRTASCLDY